MDIRDKPKAAKNKDKEKEKEKGKPFTFFGITLGAKKAEPVKAAPTKSPLHPKLKDEYTPIQVNETTNLQKVKLPESPNHEKKGTEKRKGGSKEKNEDKKNRPLGSKEFRTLNNHLTAKPPTDVDHKEIRNDETLQKAVEKKHGHQSPQVIIPNASIETPTEFDNKIIHPAVVKQEAHQLKWCGENTHERNMKEQEEKSAIESVYLDSPPVYKESPPHQS